MSDWQQPPQSEPIIMPALPVEAPAARPRWRALKIVIVVLLVVALLTSAMLNLSFLALIGGGGMSGTGELEEMTVSGRGNDNKVAIVEVSGVLMEGMNPLGGEGTYGFIVRELKQAGEDSSVKAVVLEVDSPGGGVTSSDILAHKVKELGKKKKVVVSIKGIGASGAYYMSASADKIYASPTAITGSIGVIFTSLNMKSLMDMIGVSPQVIKTGPLKDTGTIFHAMTPEQKAEIEGIVNDSFKRFKEEVSRGRNMNMEDVDHIATGGVFTSTEALDLKLIDEIGYLDEAVDGAKKLAHLKEDAKGHQVRGEAVDIENATERGGGAGEWGGNGAAGGAGYGLATGGAVLHLGTGVDG